MVKTIYFDFGNVIAFFDHWKAVRKLVAYTELSPERLYDELYDNPLEQAFERGALSTEEYVAGAIEAGKLTCTPQRFLECFRDIFTPNRDVLDLIPVLAKKYKLLLASNTNAVHFEHYCREYQPWLKHLDTRTTSHQAGHRKPGADFYAYCQQFAKAEPGECLFIDDIATNIDGGQMHGWHGLHYAAGTNLRQALATHSIHPGA
jgi:putative hydrolase of the HAD superfamily